jgi:hypothetical protein
MKYKKMAAVSVSPHFFIRDNRMRGCTGVIIGHVLFLHLLSVDLLQGGSGAALTAPRSHRLPNQYNDS